MNLYAAKYIQTYYASKCIPTYEPLIALKTTSIARATIRNRQLSETFFGF